jgi:hypothetical protein
MSRAKSVRFNAGALISAASVFFAVAGCAVVCAADQPAASKPKVVHVFVALCDNKNQGIAPVAEALGNGQDPASNLYWGALYGVSTFLKRSKDFVECPLSGKPANPAVLARKIFRLKAAGGETYVVADAYDGAKMPVALSDFFRAAAGLEALSIELQDDDKKSVTLAIGGGCDLVCFVGHNGLMDGKCAMPAPPGNARQKPAVVLACKSDAYFSKLLSELGAKPFVTTSGLMAPEAYVLAAIIRAWSAGEPADTVRSAAATAYAKYQKIPESAAARLFMAGADKKK